MDRGARWGTAVCGVAKSWTGLREFSLYKHLKEKKKRMTKKKMNFRQSKTLGCLFLKKKKRKKFYFSQADVSQTLSNLPEEVAGNSKSKSIKGFPWWCSG